MKHSPPLSPPREGASVLVERGGGKQTVSRHANALAGKQAAKQAHICTSPHLQKPVKPRSHKATNAYSHQRIISQTKKIINS